MFSLCASPRIVAQSLLISRWPAVTVVPLPAPVVATLHLFHLVQLGIRNNGKCRKCETAFFQLPRYSTPDTAGCDFFFKKRRQRVGANGRKNRRASNEGHRGAGGWRAAEVEVGPKRAPRWRLSKESSTLPRRRGRSPSGLDPFFNCIQKDRRPEKQKTFFMVHRGKLC